MKLISLLPLLLTARTAWAGPSAATHQTDPKIVIWSDDYEGHCAKANGDQETDGRILIQTYDGDEFFSQVLSCLEACRSVPGITACEYQDRVKCYAHTKPISDGDDTDDVTCYLAESYWDVHDGICMTSGGTQLDEDDGDRLSSAYSDGLVNQYTCAAKCHEEEGTTACLLDAQGGNWQHRNCVALDQADITGSSPRNRNKCMIKRDAGTADPAPSGLGPGQCLGTSGKMWGDPHFVSYDGEKYDCQGEGEFVLAESLEANDPLQVNARFITGTWGDRVKVSRSVAFKVDVDVPKIRVSIPDDNSNGCGYIYHVDDVEVNFSHFDTLDGDQVKAYQYGRNLVFKFPRTRTRIDFAASNSRKFGCWFTTNVCVTAEMHGGADNIVGILGTPNGNKADDWINRDGTHETIPSNKRDRFIQSKPWCVREYCVSKPNTLFDAGTFDDFDGCSGGDDDTSDLVDIMDKVDALPQDLKDDCHGSMACLVDTAEGTPADGQNSLAMEDHLDKLADLTPEQLEDGPDAPGAPDVEVPSFEGLGPGVCLGPTGKLWGDPHFVSFDKEKYDCQGGGEFVLAESTTPGDPLQINARFNAGSWGDRVKVSRSVAFKVDDEIPKIRVSIPHDSSNGCPYTFHIDDVEFAVGDDIAGAFQTEIDSNWLKVYEYRRNLVFMFPKYRARIDFAVARSGKFGCWMTANVCLTPEMHGGDDKIIGVLGTPNDDPQDEWTNRDGTFRTMPTNRRQRFIQSKPWCVENYCVSKPDTMFDEATFDLYDMCSPDSSTPDTSDPADVCDRIDNLPERIKQFCGDNDACLIECAEGDPSDGELSKDMEDHLDKIRDLTPEQLEDGPDAPGAPECEIPEVCVMSYDSLVNEDCDTAPVVRYIAPEETGAGIQGDPGDILYDFDFAEDGREVTFKIWDQFFGSLSTDVYVEYRKPVGAGDEVGEQVCEAIKPECRLEDGEDIATEITAFCLHSNDIALISVHYVFDESYPWDTTISECCHADTDGKSVATFTLAINCACPPEAPARLLRAEEN